MTWFGLQPFRISYCIDISLSLRIEKNLYSIDVAHSVGRVELMMNRLVIGQQDKTVLESGSKRHINNVLIGNVGDFYEVTVKIKTFKLSPKHSLFCVLR